MQLAATIAVVVSVLVFAFQARELARQSRLANEVAGTRSHGEIVLHWKQVMDVFIQYPELHHYYFDQTPETPSATDRVRLGVIAEQHADWLEALLATTNQLAPYTYSWMTAAWDDYLPRAVASWSLLRSTIRDQAEWPSLEPFVARYEASERSER
jgi:hypothetical protein